MEKFYKDLREHAMKIMNYEKRKEMIPLNNEGNENYEIQKHMQKKKLVLIKMMKMHLYYTITLEIIVITQDNLEELLIVFAI